MKHRHLDEDAGFTTAAIDDILERGMPDDWKDLWVAVVADPWGVLAEDVLRLCRDHYMYGTSLLWPEMIRQIRLEHYRISDRRCATWLNVQERALELAANIERFRRSGFKPQSR